MDEQKQNNTLGVGLIGCGAVAKIHMAAFSELPDTEIRAVMSRSESSACRAGELLNVPWYTNLDAMLQREDIDLVSICTPSGAHAEAAIAAAKAGKHVVVEKPMDITLERCDAMIAAARENHVTLACIFNNRYRLTNRFLKTALDAGRFGRILNASVTVRWYRNPEYYLSSPWHGSLALDGGGALINQSIHYIDLMQWLLGPVADVEAFRGRLRHGYIEAEDTLTAALRFESGALGTILATTASYPGYPAVIEISGERGSVRVSDDAILNWDFIDSDPMDATARSFLQPVSAQDRRASDPMAFDCSTHRRQLEGILRAIREGRTPEVDGEEGRRTVELITRIYAAAAENDR